MARRATIQSTCTKGELDPDLSERNDLEHYYNGLRRGLNCLFHPQGGFSDRGGFELVSDPAVLASGAERRLRGRIVPLDLNTNHLTAYNGGTTSALVDQDGTTLFTTNAVTAAPFSIVDVDLGVSQRVDFLDLLGFKSELADADECIAVEYFDGAIWKTFADAIGIPAAKHIRTSARTRRFGTTPGGPGGVPVAARYWRVVARTGAGTIGQISVSGLRMWCEAEGLTEIDVREVARSADTTYQVVLTERNVDVFKAQRYVASLPLAAAGQQVNQIVWAGGFDTIVMFNAMIETARLQRQGSDGEWDIAAAPFENVPSIAGTTSGTGTTASNAVLFAGTSDEVQDIDLTGLAQGQPVTVLLGDQIAARFVAGVASGWPDQVKAALQSLTGVATAAADVVATLEGASTVRIRMAGANGGRAWPLIQAIVADPASTLRPTTKVVQAGLKIDGKVWEQKTGWPVAGMFVQGRLMLTGFRCAPTTGWCSTNPNIWNFANGGDQLTADKGFHFALDVKDVEAIVGCASGQHIYLFTETGEWYGETRTLDATKPINFIRIPTSAGSSPGVPTVVADGAVMFVQKGGKTLRALRFTEDGKYGADPLTVLAPHLLSDVVDVASRKARSVTEGNLVLLVNRDKSAAMFTLLRDQNVIAGAPWSTFGGFRSAMVSIEHDLYVVTERNGRYWLERWTPDMPLDWATRYDGAPRTELTGLGYLEGRSDVWVYADDALLGPFTVTGGRVVLETAASRVIVGLEPDWTATGMPLKEKLPNAQPFRGPGRIYEVELALKGTGGLTLGTNGNPHDEVPLLRSDDRHKHAGPYATATSGAPQLPMLQRLYTGNIVRSGLLGISDHPYFELSRSAPVPVHVKAVRIEAAYKGDA